MRVLVAFDKFKDSLTALEACRIAAQALRSRPGDWTIDLCPLADGGEGFSEILTAAAGGRLVAAVATGPRGNSVAASIGLAPLASVPPAARARLAAVSPADSSKSGVAIIEMAAASGLALLARHERDPWLTSTFGTGELIRQAGDFGVAAVILGVGGSATHDLGLGALAALGLEFKSSGGELVSPPIPARWCEIDRVAGQVVPGLPPIWIACDVTNPLLGPRGAAATYGPQKGLRAADLSRLDHESARLGLMLCAHCARPDALMDAPGAGAAGGISFGLMTAAGAGLLPGFELVADWLALDRRLAAADLVITGEGRFDDSSLSGKGPGAVATRALALGKRVHVFAGSAHAPSAPAALGVHSISPADIPLDQALRQASHHLARAIAEVF